MKKRYDYLFKIVIIGNSGVGKSSLLLRFCDDIFKDSYLTTIGVDFVRIPADTEGITIPSDSRQ